MFGALGLLVGWGLSYVAAARVTRPVEDLADAARAVADGRWDVQVASSTAGGEVGGAGAEGTLARCGHARGGISGAFARMGQGARVAIDA